GQLAVVPVVHARLVVVEVHLRRTADHVQVDDLAGLRREVRAGRRGRGVGACGAGSPVAAEQRGQRGPADGIDAAAEELAAGFVAKPIMDRIHGITPIRLRTSATLTGRPVSGSRYDGRGSATEAGPPSA